MTSPSRSRRAPRPATDERRGLALPIVLLAALLLAAALGVTFIMVGSERRVISGYQSQVLALSLAETGLERCAHNPVSCGLNAAPITTYDSVRVTLANGYADVVIERLRDTSGTLPALLLIRSTGVLTRRGAGRDPLASRTVAAMATWSATKLSLPGGFTSLNGLSITGGAATLTGTPPGGCVGFSGISGVAVPTAPGYSGPGVGGGIKTLGTPADAADSVMLDWNGIANGNAITPSVTIPPGSWPGAGWHVIKAIGDLSVSHSESGSGVLIVTGDLTMNGNWDWNGVILVGGAITSNGNDGIQGAIISGLNHKLGTAVPGATDIGHGNKTIQYNPCMVDSALAQFSSLTLQRNTWTDSYPTP